jgi:hypothetical protein
MPMKSAALALSIKAKAGCTQLGFAERENAQLCLFRVIRVASSKSASGPLWGPSRTSLLTTAEPA